MIQEVLKCLNLYNPGHFVRRCWSSYKLVSHLHIVIIDYRFKQNNPNDDLVLTSLHLQSSSLLILLQSNLTAGWKAQFYCPFWSPVSPVATPNSEVTGLWSTLVLHCGKVTSSTTRGQQTQYFQGLLSYSLISYYRKKYWAKMHANHLVQWINT